MSTATFSALAGINTDAQVKDWITKLLAALDSFPSLTKVTNQLNRPAGNAGSFTGTANIDLVDKTFTGGTNVLNATTLTGATFTPVLNAVTDIGRQVKINGGTTSYAYISAIDTATNTVTFSSGLGNARSGTATGTIGVILSAVTLGAVNFNGFVIYRFNDTLQTTSPIFIKFTLGNYCGNSSVADGGTTQLVIQVGTQLDGLGNFVGNFTASNFSSSFSSNILGSGGSASSDNTISSVWYLSADNGRFSISRDVNSTTSVPRAIASVSRGLNEAGVMIGDYCQYIIHNVSNGVIQTKQYVLHKNTVSVIPSNEGFSNAVMGIVGTAFTTYVYDGNTTVIPIQPLVGRLRPFCKDVLIAKATDFPPNGIFTIDGSNYISVSTSPTNVATLNQVTNAVYLVRYQ